MKHRVMYLIFSLLMGSALMAQTTGRIGTHDAVATWTPSTPSTFSNVSEGRKIAQDIIDVVGLKANFDIREANIPNAAAVVYGGQRYILYNPNFIRQLEKTTGTKWAAISVLAHEIGHHLNGHTITAAGSQPNLELEADEFSGFVLRKMGASLQDAQAAMKALADINATRTHPGKDDRLTSIANGWERADAQASGRVAKIKPIVTPSQPVAVSTPVVSRSTSARQTAIDDRYILGDVSFAADNSASYFVTTRMNLVRVKNNQLSVIGKLTTLNSRQFPYLIYDDSNTQLLVASDGTIVSRDGRSVGKLTARK